MTTWIILIRESQKWMIRHLASQAIVVLRSTGVWNSGDRLLVVIERCSSVAHAWANRPVYRWLQQQAGLTDFKLLTVHPTRLTRRSNELDEIVNYLHAKGGQWLSRGVPNQPRDVLANPMESSTLPALRQLLDETLVASSHSGSMVLRRKYTTDYVLDSLEIKMPIVDIEGIKAGLKLLFDTRRHDKIVIVTRISPFGDGDHEEGRLDQQEKLLKLFIPTGVDHELIRVAKSAYRTDQIEVWHETLVNHLKPLAQKGKTALVISASLDRMTRREEGLELYKSLKQHTFVSMLWHVEKPLHGDPLSWAGISRSESDSTKMREAMSTFTTAVDSQSKLLKMNGLLALVAPIVYDIVSESSTHEISDSTKETVEQLIKRHMEAAYLGGKHIASYTWGAGKVPDELSGLNSNSTLHATAEPAKLWISKQYGIQLTDISVEILPETPVTAVCRREKCSNMASKAKYHGFCSYPCYTENLREMAIHAPCARPACDKVRIVGGDLGVYCSRKCRSDDRERIGAPKAPCTFFATCGGYRFVGGLYKAYCSSKCYKLAAKQNAAAKEAEKNSGGVVIGKQSAKSRKQVADEAASEQEVAPPLKKRARKSKATSS